jgi:phenylpropionate dioxygenase-like ring-hydroxylating dioxygenase large terminal subunit
MKKYLSLEPKYYYSEEVYSKEIERIYSKLWIFVGLTNSVQKNNSYITKKIANVPIFIQNTNGEIAAFVNQCPHRLSPIHHNPYGVRKINCQYHGWSFNNEGKLIAIPNEELYNFSLEEKENLNLQKINIKIIGKLIFINFHKKPIEINEQFNEELINSLDKISNYFDDQIAYTSFPVKTNWKLNLEVIKDPNHIPFVHAKSFAPWLKKETEKKSTERIKTEWRETDEVRLESLSYTSNAVIVDSEPWYRSLIDRYSTSTEHLSWYLYPNTHFASVRGDYFFIQQYDPSSKDGIDFNLWIFTSKKKDKATDFTALLRALMIEERKIIEEDAIVLSRIQASLGSWSKSPTHGAYEYHIACQNKWYINNVIF